MKLSIDSQIRITSARCLIAPVAVLIIVIAAVLIVPFGQVFKPNEAGSVSDIIALKNSGEKYVHYSLENLRYTGYDYFEGGEVAASYYYILEEGSYSNCLFFLIPIENTADRAALLYNYSASAKLLTGDKYFDAFLSNYSDDIGWSYEGLKEICEDLLVSDFHYFLEPMVAVFVLMMIILILCLGLVVTYALRIIFPRLHPAYRRLRKFGLDSSDFLDMEEEAENSQIIKAGNMTVTEHYLIAAEKMDLWIIPLFNIVWVFEYSRWRPLRIRDRLIYTLNIITSPKDKFVICGNAKKDINAIIDFLEDNFSHITIGYTDEIRGKMNPLL